MYIHGRSCTCMSLLIVHDVFEFLQDADKGITKMLKEMGRLVHQSTYNHNYPFCWRSVGEHSYLSSSIPSLFTFSLFLALPPSLPPSLHYRSETPLIYKAVPSWFIQVEVIVQELLENNKKCYW